MAGLDGRRMFDALRDNSSKIGSSLTKPSADKAAWEMYSLRQLSMEEKELVRDGKSLVNVVLQKETSLPDALLELMKAFVTGLRAAEANIWADIIERAGQHGATNPQDKTIAALHGATQKTENKNADTVDAAPAPTRRDPYPRGKGRAIIIYIAKFISTNAGGSVPGGTNDAPGNAIDGKNLATFFREKCGFYVEEIFNESATCMNIMHRLTAVASGDNDQYKMFVCAVLSHGGMNEDNKCYVKDYGLNDLLVEDITAPFKNAIGLAAKPKVFIFNACRGEKFEACHVLSGGAPRLSEAKNHVYIPREAHFLHFYSSVEGYYALTCESGSVFVEKLLETLRDENGLDVVAAFTDVIGQVTEFGPVLVQYKKATGELTTSSEVVPTPCIVSTLTRRLYFR